MTNRHPDDRKKSQLFQSLVRWIDSEVTKVDALTDGMKMVFDALRVRWIHRKLS